MTAHLGAPYYLRIGGTWFHIANVRKGVPITPNRPTSLFYSLGNTVYARVSAVAKRAWGFSFEWEDAEATRWLDYAAANPDAEAWLLDGNLAQINMLPKSATQGRSPTLVDVDGLGMRSFLALETATIKVRKGITYHLSYTTTATAGSVLGKLEFSDNELGTFGVVAPSGTGARRGSMSITAPADEDLTIEWTSAGTTSGARFTEGSVDTLGFLESRGATPCRVLVGDGAATYKMAWNDRLALADSSYVLTEVG
ncbi:MAG: hypothetical protein ABWX92_07590 [Mycetocola sp.]